MNCFLIAAGLLIGAQSYAWGQSERLTVVMQGKAVGIEAGEIRGSEIAVEYEWAANGRSPKEQEQITLDRNGIPINWTVTGRTMMGIPAREHFEYSNGHAKWTSQADTGDVPLPAPRLYTAVDASPWILGVYARALLKAPNRHLDVLPGGSMTLTRLQNSVIASGPSPVPVTIYRLDGVELSPDYVVLDGKQAMFAHFSARTIAVRQGYEAAIPQVLGMLSDLEAARVRDITHRVAHHFDKPVRFSNVHILDPRGGTLSDLSTVVTMGTRIVTVLPETAATANPEGEVVIDGQGGTLMPGLHDMHTHTSIDSGLFYLAAGITSARDMGNVNSFFLGLLPSLQSGEFAGPRLHWSGILEGHSQYALNMGFQPNTMDEAMREVRWYSDNGYWQIKFYSSFNPEWVKPLAAEAHRLGMQVAGHVPAFTNSDRMVQDGYDNVVHINNLMFTWLLPPDADTRTLLRVSGLRLAAHLDLSSAPVRHSIALMQSHHTVVDPTASIVERLMLGRAGEEADQGKDYLDHMPMALQRYRKRTSVPIASPEQDEEYKQGFAVVLKTLKLLDDSGIQLLPGTDDNLGLSLHRELELYTMAGISTAKSLRLGTLSSDEYFHQSDELGTIEKGKLADFILLAGDPLKDIRAIKKPRVVVKDGVVFFPDEIYREIGIKPFTTAPPVTGR
jgi:imidazolonepropionase-like amidohydrolase